SYATLGEIVAWIIGWDLILEYAVGNVAVAISWGDYFTSLLKSFDFHLPVWLTTGYRTALLSPDPALHGLLQSAPRVAGIPILVNVPAFVIVAFITWLLMLGVRESATANNIMVTIKLLVLGLFVVAGLTHLNTANFHPFAPNGFRGVHQGAAIVFFAYIGFDAISTAAEETKNPQRNLPIGILGGLAICTVIYMIVGGVLTGMVPYTELGVDDPLAKALNSAGFTTVGWIVALGAIISMSAVLLVFQYGQPRIFFAMGRDGLLPPWAAKVHAKTRVPHITTLITGIFVGLWSLIGDAGETYNLTNIGTLFAFVLVCIGVLVKLHTKIFIGLLAGGLSGLAVNVWAGGAAWVGWVNTNVAGPVGQVFLRILFMTVVPLVFTSIALGVTQLGDIRKVGRVGVRSLGYFLLSTVISAAIGILLVNLVRPGVGVPVEVRQQLLDAYRGQVAGLPAGATTRFGVDFFV